MGSELDKAKELLVRRRQAMKLTRPEYDVENGESTICRDCGVLLSSGGAHALTCSAEALLALVERLERERDDSVDVLEEVWTHHAIDLSPQLCDRISGLLPKKPKPVCKTCGDSEVVYWSVTEDGTETAYDRDGYPYPVRVPVEGRRSGPCPDCQGGES